jgi:isopenicillin N synthase-like dioxygenase
MGNMNAPVIDLSTACGSEETRKLGSEIYQHLRAQGYFFVRGTSFTDERLSKLFETSNRFFDLPHSEKERISRLCRFDGNLISAYLPPGIEHINNTNDPENKEVLEFWTEHGYNTNYIVKILKGDPVVAEDDLWGPPALARVKDSLLGCYADLIGIVYFLSDCLALFLREEADFFSKNFGQNNNCRITRALRDDRPQKKDVIRIGAHEDHGCFTCVLHEPGYESGFQVFRAGDGWRSVAKPKDGIYIHGGNMLSLWTNGEIPATPHRVVDPGWGRNRHAINLFTGTNQDVRVSTIAACIADGQAQRAPFIAADAYRIMTDSHAMHVAGESSPTF